MASNYKLVAIDADGTLLDSARQISARNKKAIQEASACGVRIVLCSGRSYKSLRMFAEELGLLANGNYVIAFNGGLIIDSGTDSVISESRLPQELAREIVEIAKPFSPAAATIAYQDIHHILVNPNIDNIAAYIQASKTEPIYVSDVAEAITHDIPKVMLVGAYDDLYTPAALLRAKFSGRCNMFFSSQYLFELIAPNTSKGAGLQALCRHLQIPISQTIAIGDNFNDASMIQAAGLGVCMANGEDDVKALAGYVTSRDCDHSGVAEVLEKFI